MRQAPQGVWVAALTVAGCIGNSLPSASPAPANAALGDPASDGQPSPSTLAPGALRRGESPRFGLSLKSDGWDVYEHMGVVVVLLAGVNHTVVGQPLRVTVREGAVTATWPQVLELFSSYEVVYFVDIHANQVCVAGDTPGGAVRFEAAATDLTLALPDPRKDSACVSY